MTYEPREQQTIYESVRDRIKGKIPALTNFTNTSFNWVWVQGFASEMREQELDKTAAYLSGLIDYAGGPLTEQDLIDLGIEDLADVEEINERLEDEDLDRLVKILGVKRSDGNPSSGSVTFTTINGATTIQKGTSVGTIPDESGNFLEFTTDGTVDTANGVTTVTANVTAVENGDEYNVGSGALQYLPSPPNGVQAVTNTSATSGGEDRETNDELRERAKGAIFASSGGGTVQGVIGFIENEIPDAGAVDIIEFFNGDTWHGNYPHSHVVVDGGNESDIENAIEDSRPVAVEHFLVRPEAIPIRVDADIETSSGGANIATVKDNVEGYINSLGLDDEVVETKIIQKIHNADEAIEDITNLNIYVENESEFWDSATNVYNLEFGEEMQNDGITNVEGTLNSSTHTFSEGSDYEEIDDFGGASDDSIDWSLGGDTPDTNTGETKTKEFQSGKNEYLIDEAMVTDGISQVTGTLSGSSHTFTEGTDYEEVDIRGDGVINGINWGIGGDSPDDETDFTVTYTAGTSFRVTYLIKNDTDLNFDQDKLPISGSVNITEV